MKNKYNKYLIKKYPDILDDFYNDISLSKISAYLKVIDDLNNEQIKLFGLQNFREDIKRMSDENKIKNFFLQQKIKNN